MPTATVKSQIVQHKIVISESIVLAAPCLVKSRTSRTMAATSNVTAVTKPKRTKYCANPPATAPRPVALFSEIPRKAFASPNTRNASGVQPSAIPHRKRLRLTDAA